MPSVEITPELECTLPTPVRIPLPAGAALPAGALVLREEGGSRTGPAQREGDALIAVIGGLRAGARVRFRIAPDAAARGVSLSESGPHALAIQLPQGPFTTYHFDPALPRPFFYPLLSAAGSQVTRGYPMKPDVPGETRDHPHHRSFWTAYGEVNDVDDWSEAAGKHGWIKHQKFLHRDAGPAFGGFTASAVWTAHDGRPVLDEKRALRVYNAGPYSRLLDYDVELTASHGDVHYGDTKEGGILAFRVATTMDGNKGGKMENSTGGVGEKQCWGKRAAWLDYSGPVAGGEIAGIGMMDHPSNLAHPCFWHARDYGLVGTNPFARAAFEGGAKTGYTQKRGQALRFRYRVLIHAGDARAGRVDEAFHSWIQPPAGRFVG